MQDLELPELYREGDTIIIGFDSEYVPPPPTVQRRKAQRQAGEKPESSKNDVVSYQAYVLSGAGEYRWFRPMPKGERLRFAQLIKAILTEASAAGALATWPKTIHLAIHWSLADLTTLKDFRNLKTEFDGIRKTYATVGPAYALNFWDNNRNKREVSVHLFDTLLLAPDGARKLEDLGKLIGVSKVTLPEGAIEDMRRFSETDPDLFREYGLQDAVIAARWLVFSHQLNRNLFGQASTPLTLGSIALKLVEHIWTERSVQRLKVLGLEMTRNEEGKPEEVHRSERRSYGPLARDGYHGGRNETFWFGATPEGEWTDWDLAGAYVTGLCSLGTPIWENIRRPRTVREFGENYRVYGVALVEFSFPDDTRFPCLPVRTDTSLIFPLQGVSMATAPEVDLALRLGARLRILNDVGYIMPMVDDRPFGEVAQLVTDKRAELKAAGKKGSAEELGIKTIGNSVYGKLSQGLRRKKMFQTREATMEMVPPSRITNEFLAAHTTGIVRAALSEIIASIPPEFIVVSATTDGFITNAPDAVVRQAATGPICRYYLELRQGLDPACQCILEVKHRTKQVLAWRTRGQATLIGGSSDDPKNNTILAKAGISVPQAERSDPNAYIIRRFLRRGIDPDKDQVERFRGLREIYEADGRFDLTRKIVYIATGMDFDWKAIPDQITTRPIQGIEHIAFSTKPLPSAAAYEYLRADWKVFSKKGTDGRRRHLKSQRDLSDFFDRLAVVPGKSYYRSRGGKAGEVVVVRMFLRAYYRELLGLDGRFKPKQLVKRLTDLGLSVKLSDIDNAKRTSNSVIYECLRETPGVLDVIRKLKSLFPTFQPEQLFSMGENPLAYDEQLHSRLGGDDPRQLTFALVEGRSA